MGLIGAPIGQGGRLWPAALLAAVLAGFLVVEPSPKWAPDYGSYIALSRSLLFDRDLLFINDLELVSALVWTAPARLAACPWRAAP